jgi:8-oxo-dGTP pyrophosphatase MutT (NUDIX family)
MKTLDDFMSKKAISAGVIFVCPSGVLLCHPTGKPYGKHNWDLPKGHAEPNEDHINTAIREVREETGIVITKEQLVDLGMFPYIKNKDLHLYKCQCDKDIDISTLKCSSTFVLNPKEEIPEMDDYMITKDLDYLYKSYQKIFEKINLNL